MGRQREKSMGLWQWGSKHSLEAQAAQAQMIRAAKAASCRGRGRECHHNTDPRGAATAAHISRRPDSTHHEHHVSSPLSATGPRGGTLIARADAPGASSCASVAPATLQAPNYGSGTRSAALRTVNNSPTGSSRSGSSSSSSSRSLLQEAREHASSAPAMRSTARRWC